MKTTLMIALAALLAAPAVTGHADDVKKKPTIATKTTDAVKPAVKGTQPAASPGWIIVEEDFWFPLRFEPLYSLDSIRVHYRRNEEKAAANEIDKAISWLKLAATHAQPVTKGNLTTAATELSTVAKDLRSGTVSGAAKMDSALAKAAHALGEWHYYKSKESWGKSEAQDAGRDLELAAQYLQHAANSAHYQFGPDTRKVITKFYSGGKMTGTTTHYDHNALGMHLQGVEKAIKELGVVLKK